MCLSPLVADALLRWPAHGRQAGQEESGFLEEVFVNALDYVPLLVLYPYVVADHETAQRLSVDQDDPGRHRPLGLLPLLGLWAHHDRSAALPHPGGLLPVLPESLADRLAAGTLPCRHGSDGERRSTVRVNDEKHVH